MADRASFERSFAYVASAVATPVSVEGIAACLESRFPEFSPSFQALSEHGEGHELRLALANIPFNVISVPAKLPRTEWEQGARANLAWPEAVAAMTRCASHMVVAPIGVPEDRRAAPRFAMTTTIMAAAVAQSCESVGVCWVPAHTLVEPGAFSEMARAMIAGGQLQSLPLDSWMSLHFGRANGGYAARSRGLIALLGFEIQVTEATPDPARQGAILYDVAGHLIREGAEFADGDTVETAQGAFVATMDAVQRQLLLAPSERTR